MEPTKALTAVAVIAIAAIAGPAAWKIYDRLWSGNPASGFEIDRTKRSLIRPSPRRAKLYAGWRTETRLGEVVHTAPSGRRYAFAWAHTKRPSTHIANTRLEARRREAKAILRAEGGDARWGARDGRGSGDSSRIVVGRRGSVGSRRPRAGQGASLTPSDAHLGRESVRPPSRREEDGFRPPSRPAAIPASMGPTESGEDDSPDDSTSGTYLSPGSGHQVRSVSEGGRLVELEDGSLWEIGEADLADTGAWQPEEDITVIHSSGGYVLLNRDRGERVSARHLGG